MARQAILDRHQQCAWIRPVPTDCSRLAKAYLHSWVHRAACPVLSVYSTIPQKHKTRDILPHWANNIRLHILIPVLLISISRDISQMWSHNANGKPQLTSYEQNSAVLGSRNHQADRSAVVVVEVNILLVSSTLPLPTCSQGLVSNTALACCGGSTNPHAMAGDTQAREGNTEQGVDFSSLEWMSCTVGEDDAGSHSPVA